DSLTDFLGGVEVQRTNRFHEPRQGQSLAFDLPDPGRLVATRDRFFETSDPGAKRALLDDLAEMEDTVVADIFAKVRAEAEIRLLDLETHYGERHDLMIHFGQRALELLRPGGVMSVIFSDTLLTSIDGDEFRRHLTTYDGRKVALHAMARTRCFVGVAVNGA